MSVRGAPTNYDELVKLVLQRLQIFQAFANTRYQLQNDVKVKVAGIDVDGVMRGKVMQKEVRPKASLCRKAHLIQDRRNS
jgi:hypothetical protein